MEAGSQSILSQTKPERVQAEQRKKKIRVVEQQLAKQASSSSVETNSQTRRDLPFKMAGSKTMVAPGARDAPKFSSKKPQELRRFVRLMEDLWKEAGIVNDEEKKSSIGKYADQESEEEWAALETYGYENTWEEFKEELIENYPEAAEAERGTPARIRLLCSETRHIRLGDLPALYAFRRAFMAEAKKLIKPPAAMANRELVELFIGCLSEPLVAAVLQFLGNNLPSNKPKMKATGVPETEKSTVRRPEDKYDLEDVCKAAIQVSESSQGMFHLMGKSSVVVEAERAVFAFEKGGSNVLTQKIEELENSQAVERDNLVNVNKNMDTKFGELENMMKVLISQTQAMGSANKVASKVEACKSCKQCEVHSGASGASASVHKCGKSMENERCFFCGCLGHFQGDCEELKNQVRTGNLKINPEGKLRLRDGSLIPNFPNATSLKERVERHYSKRPSQFFYGEYEDDDNPLVPKYSAQYLNMGESQERRRARLEKELDLREKEEALELRKLKLEREEKKLEKASGNSRAANMLDVLGQLTEDEVVAIKAARAGFP